MRSSLDAMMILTIRTRTTSPTMMRTVAMEKVRTKRVSGGDGDDDDNGEKDNTKIKRTL